MSAAGDEGAYLAALIALHDGLPRQGPGDDGFTRDLLRSLPALPADPRIADLGCGSGAGALLLAERFGARVRAVDLSRTFLDRMMQRARGLGLDHLVEPVEADFGALGWPPGSLDLIWSEGAAYHLTFAGALRAWRPLLAPGGLAVISELSWFAEAPPAAAREFWRKAYPAMAGEAANAGSARQAGFEVLGIRRLPAEAWWANYYGPLRRRIEALGPPADAATAAVIADTEAEMAQLRDHGDSYGYTFYLLRAA